MINLNRIPGKVLIGVALLTFILLACVIGLSYMSNAPFLISGKSFGFGSEELQKRTIDLEKSVKILSEIRQELDVMKAENLQLKELNSKLISVQQARTRDEAAMWFPIDDVEFEQDGSFSVLDGRNGQGKWSNRDSELTLQLMGLDALGVVLGTNLPAPGNKVRIQTGQAVFVPMSKWDYRVSAVEAYSSLGKAVVRVERRDKRRSEVAGS